VKYFIFSCLSSIIDLSISYVLYEKINLNYLLACNLGIISGLIFHYFYSMKYVFKKDGLINSFIIYMLTFFLGLILANGIMCTSYELGHLSFIISKILSMIGPFFITYFIRKRLLGVKTNTIKEI